MTVVVTGATGHLGRLVVESLLERGVAPADIVATGRRVEALEPLAARGVRTAVADFADPSTLAPAFAGADALLLVSTNVPGDRVAGHTAAITAAVEAGVGRIVYTSAPRADDTTLVLAPEHKGTEEAIAASGLPATILRNGWYHENYAQTVEQARATGVVLTSTAGGKVASAARPDFAEAAAAVLVEDGHVGKVYELSGDVAWDFDEFARELSGVLGRDVVHRSVSSDEHLAALVSAGLDEGTAGFVVALDRNVAEGTLDETSGDLARLIGHPTTPLADGLKALAG